MMLYIRRYTEKNIEREREALVLTGDGILYAVQYTCHGSRM